MDNSRPWFRKNRIAIKSTALGTHQTEKENDPEFLINVSPGLQ